MHPAMQPAQRPPPPARPDTALAVDTARSELQAKERALLGEVQQLRESALQALEQQVRAAPCRIHSQARAHRPTSWPMWALP